MIQADQPTIFGKELIAAVSSRSDGNMSFKRGDTEHSPQNRRAFLEVNGIAPEHTSLVEMTYATDDFTRYRIVTDEDKGEGVLEGNSRGAADALVTTHPGHGLFLTIADCCGAILYDPKKHVLMVSHLGRHNAEVQGARKSVEYLQQQFGCNASDIKIWLGPAVGKETYPIFKLDGAGLLEAIQKQLQEAGIPSENIEICHVDTALTDDYFSHSRSLADSTVANGGFAVAAMMT